MSADALLEAVAILNPRTMARAHRLCFVINLLRSGVSPQEVRRVVKMRFKTTRIEAWRVVDMAEDMVTRV